MSILLYGCITWMLTKRLERKIDGSYPRMLPAVLNKSWRQHPTKLQLYGHLLSISKNTQNRWARRTGFCWRSKYEHISGVRLWTPSHGRARFGRPARTYLQLLCTDSGCSMEDLPKAMDDMRERIRKIHASGMSWWYYLPNPPLGQDMTQGQFLSGV